MECLKSILRFLIRFRYPVSLPEEIAEDIGVDISNFITFDDFVDRLSSPNCQPRRLKKYMSREKAEGMFQCARRKERFHSNTLYSYYFNEGWVEFILKFDEASRLRRIYLQHKNIQNDHGVEIPLMDPSSAPPPPVAPAATIKPAPSSLHLGIGAHQNPVVGRS